LLLCFHPHFFVAAAHNLTKMHPPLRAGLRTSGCLSSFASPLCQRSNRVCTFPKMHVSVRDARSTKHVLIFPPSCLLLVSQLTNSSSPFLLNRTTLPRNSLAPAALLSPQQRQLCADFHVESYPTLTFGSAQQFVGRENVTRHPGSLSREASAMVAWVGEQMNRWVCGRVISKVG